MRRLFDLQCCGDVLGPLLYGLQVRTERKNNAGSRRAAYTRLGVTG